MDPHRQQDTFQPLSTVLRDFIDGPEERVTLDMMLDRFGHRSFGTLLFAIAILCLLPGAAAPIGLVLALVAAQVAIGFRHVWLPAFLRRRSISRQALSRGLTPVIGRLERIERFSSPRLSWVFGSVGDRLIGLVAMVLALVIILPIPFGNILPAASVALLALALVLKDGVIALLGYAATGGTVVFLGLTGHLAMGAIRHVLRTLHACPDLLCSYA
jgi:hypothetical protein